MNSTPPVPTSEKPGKSGQKWFILLLIGFVAVCCICCLAVAIYGYNEFKGSARIVEDARIHPATTAVFSLSADQQRVVDKYGYPDSFSITFYREEFAPDFNGYVRDESWRYFDELESFSFYNGQLNHEGSIDPPASGWLPAMYTPDQFEAYAKLQQVLDAAGIRDYFELPLEEELVENGRLFFARGLTFGLADDRLIYVETISMTESEGTDE